MKKHLSKAWLGAALMAALSASLGIGCQQSQEANDCDSTPPCVAIADKTHSSVRLSMHEALAPCSDDPSCRSFAAGLDGLARRNTNDAITAQGRAIEVPVAKAKQRLMDAGLDEYAAELAAGITPTDVAAMAGGAIAARVGAKNDIATSEGKANAATGKRLGGVLGFQEGSGRQDTSNDAEYIAKTDRSIIVEKNFDTVRVLSGEINRWGEATGYHAEFAAKGAARIKPGAAIPTPNANGTYEAPVQIWDAAKGQWVDKRRESTFFPSSWSQARIEYEVTEAYKTNLPPPEGGWLGTTPSGIEIQFYWDSKNGRTTFHPTGR